MVSEHFEMRRTPEHHICKRCEAKFPELNYGLCSFCEEDIRERSHLLKVAWGMESLGVEPTKVTEKEKMVIDDIANSDFSTDGYGLGTWIDESYFRLPMVQVRALLTTLSQKEVCGVSSAEEMGDRMGWVSIRDNYQEEVTDSSDALARHTGYRLINLEVIK